MDAATRANRIRDALPAGGLFDGHEWRIATKPFPLGARFVRELESLGRVLLKFYRAADLLYRQSLTGKQPAWVAEWLDQGKPHSLLDWQRHVSFKTALPRVLRPDILLTEEGWHITELDSVPGGIGLTGWLNESYGKDSEVIGETHGMINGFAGMFDGDGSVKLIVSDESATYRPEMEWLCQRAGERFTVHNAGFDQFAKGDSVYRFFELFDLDNVPNHQALFELATTNQVQLTPPPKAYLEEKMVLGLLWNHNLREFWQRELGGKFFIQLRNAVPQTWIMDPAPLPPHAAMPGLDLTNWQQLSALSKKDRQLVLKLSGYHERAWGARSVRLGHDLSQPEWATAVTEAITDFEQSPWVLQRFKKPRSVQHEWFDFESGEVKTMHGRVRLCPYYFVHGEETVTLSGVLATVCPADKKIIHGMRDAILAPCGVGEVNEDSPGNL